MNAIAIAVVVAVSAALSVSGSARGRELRGLEQYGPVRVMSSAASPTVLSTLVSRDGQLVLLVLWRGSPGRLARGGGRASSQAGGGGNQTWVQLTRGELTLSVEVDHARGVAHVLKQTVSVKKNVVLVDAVDTTPVVQTALVAHRQLSDAQYFNELSREIVARQLERRATGTPADWTMESLQLARVALLPAEGVVDEMYYRAQISVVDERLGAWRAAAGGAIEPGSDGRPASLMLAACPGCAELAYWQASIRALRTA